MSYPVDSWNMSAAELAEYLSGDSVECLLCGKTFRSLGQHLVRTHGIECDDYRERYGIPYTHTLNCEATEKILSEQKTALAQDPEERERLRKVLASGRETLLGLSRRGVVSRAHKRSRDLCAGRLCRVCKALLKRRDGEPLPDFGKRLTCSQDCETRLRASNRPEVMPEPSRDCLECGRKFDIRSDEQVSNYRNRITCSWDCESRKRAAPALYFFQGEQMTVREISEALGMSATTVRRRILPELESAHKSAHKPEPTPTGTTETPTIPKTNEPSR